MLSLRSKIHSLCYISIIALIEIFMDEDESGLNQT